MTSKSFLCYFDWIEALSELEDADERWEIFIGIAEYARCGLDPNFNSPTSRIIFRMAQPIIDSNREKYERRCESNRQNALKGSRQAKDS